MFRGNPERNRSGVGTVPRHPKLLWRFRTKTKVEGPYERRGDKHVSAGTPWHGLGWTGQPVRRGDRVYFGSTDSYVYCLDAATGKEVWHYGNHHSIKGSIMISGDRIYHGGRDNRIHCYSLDGKRVWETRIGNDCDSNPAIVAGRGFIGGEDYRIYCFDPVGGAILWAMGPTNGSVESSPCVVGDHVIAGAGFGVLYCCDAATGEVVWTAKTGGDMDSTPVHFDGRIYVGSKTKVQRETGALWCFRESDGRKLWRVPLTRGVWGTAAVDREKRRVYIGCNNSYTYCLDANSGKLVWKRSLRSRIWSSVVVADGCVLVGVRDGTLWCLNESDGRPLWVFDDGFDIDATPLVAGGMIVIGSQNGWVYGIGEAPKGEKLNRHWFRTDADFRQRTDHGPAGIPTVHSSAPAPKAYRDTRATSPARPATGKTVPPTPAKQP
jgi:outer membrane protein assembly factor BamB